jgi:hypothetical protein
VVDAARMIDLTAGSVTLRRARTRRRPIAASILTSRTSSRRAVAFAARAFPPDARDLFRLILIHHVEFTPRPERRGDRAATAPRRGQRARREGQVLQGQAIVRQADPIGPRDPRAAGGVRGTRSATAGSSSGKGSRSRAVAGSWLLTVLLLSIFGLLLYFNRPEVYANFRWLLLIALLVAAYFGAGIVIDRGGLAAEWLPIAFVALPVAVLWDTRMALFLVLVLAVITGTLAAVLGTGPCSRSSPAGRPRP